MSVYRWFFLCILISFLIRLVHGRCGLIFHFSLGLLSLVKAHLVEVEEVGVCYERD